MNCTCETNAPGISLCNHCCERFEEMLVTCDQVDAQLSEAIRDVSMTANYGGMGGSGGGAQHAPAPLNVTALSARMRKAAGLFSSTAFLTLL